MESNFTTDEEVFIKTKCNLYFVSNKNIQLIKAKNIRKVFVLFVSIMYTH